MIITALLLPGLLLPTESLHSVEELAVLQKNNPLLYQLSSTFNPPAMAGSWTFIFLNIVLLTSTVLCSIERIRNRRFTDPQAREPKYSRHKRVLELAGTREDFAEKARLLLRRSRWRPTVAERTGRTIVAGRKGDFGFWGSIVFHLGFLVLLFGIIISARTRLNANILITEGQTVSLLNEGFTTVVKAPERVELPEFEIRLDKVISTYEASRFPTNYSSRLTFLYPRGERAATAGVNLAANYDDLTFLMENYGYAPKFIVHDDRGRELLNGFVNLKGREPNSMDEITAKDGLKIETRFFPDYYEPKPRQAGNRSLEAKNPVFLIKAVQGEKTIFNGPVALGASVRMQKYDLLFPEIRKWAYLKVTRDKGAPFIFFGLVVAVAGLVIRFAVHEKTVHVVVSDEPGKINVVIAGKSRYFPALFVDEIDRIANTLGPGGKKVSV